MMISQVLKEGIKELRKSHIDSPALDAEVLLSFLTGLTKEKILTHPEINITTQKTRRYFNLIKRRAKHEPVAYIIGHKEFYGFDFLVNKNVLIPRPETETLIEAVQDCFFSLAITKKESLVIDVGTGSGAIAITLAKLFKKAKVFASDISNDALKVARKNAARHGVKINFKKGDLISPWFSTSTFGLRSNNNFRHFFITANLPYLPTSEWRATQPEVKKFEPKNALDGGKDGLKFYKKLLGQIATLAPLARNDIHIFLEFDPEQTNPLKKLVLKYFPKSKIEIKKDLAGLDRIMTISLLAQEISRLATARSR